MKYQRRSGASRRDSLYAVGAVAASAALLAAGTASASSGIDSPESGVVQSGRGNAWLARADDPLAVYFNPAALAFQASGVHVGAQLMFSNRCYSRLGPDGKPVSPGNSLPGPGDQGGPPAAVCSNSGAFPNPQLAATFRITDRFALGIAVVAPHATGKSEWPESLTYNDPTFGKVSEPGPARYMLVSSNSLIVFPTVSVAYAPLDNLSFGAGFVWGIASIEFVNFTEALSGGGGGPNTDQYDKNHDVKARLTAKDLFIPGLVLSSLWMPTSNLDVSGWFKWTDAVRADGDLHLESSYWKADGSKNVLPAPCSNGKDPTCTLTDAKGAGHLVFHLPMEAKLGLRFHHPRIGGPKPAWASSTTRRVRDPLSQDVFDIELDFTYANNSAVDNLQLRFDPGITVNGTGGTVPVNGDIPHRWKDVMGIRLGGDVVPIANRLTLRTGGFFEAKGQSDQYLNVDFDVAEKIGIGGGATVRLGPVDVSASYQHTFYGTLDNHGTGALKALSGDVTTNYRSVQTINGGRLTAELNEVGLSGTLRY